MYSKVKLITISAESIYSFVMSYINKNGFCEDGFTRQDIFLNRM